MVAAFVALYTFLLLLLLFASNGRCNGYVCCCYCYDSATFASTRTALPIGSLSAHRRPKPKHNSANAFWSVLLLKDTPLLGDKGEVKQVRPGYAFNYLFPRGYARRASPINIVNHEARLLREVELKQHRNEQLNELKAGLSSICLELSMPPHKNARQQEAFWGTVQAKDIVDQLKSLGYSSPTRPFEASDIKFRNHIATFGLHTVDVVLQESVTAPLKIRIRKSR